MDSWDNDDQNCSVDYFISTKFGGDNTYQSMNVKTSIQNNSTHVIDHNYVGNQPISYRSEHVDSWDNDHENCSVDYFISTKFGGDNTYQSMNVKTSIQNNSTYVIGHNYVGNQPILYWSKRMDSWDNDDENCSVDCFISTKFNGDNTYQRRM